MPLRSDPTVWYNMPGVVAAYQPIGAPGPLLARYNQAHGGDNRYRCEPGTLPTWAGHTGWTFNGSSQYLTTGVAPSSGSWSMIVRYSGATSGESICGMYVVGKRLDLGWNYLNQVVYGNGDSRVVGPQLATGVLGVAGQQGYRNGKIDGASFSGWSGVNSPLPVYIGNRNGAASYFPGNIQCFILSQYTLSIAQVFSVSRQMAYCHVNSDWSAWGRKRRWYYAPSQAGFQAAWARNSNAQIGTGVN